MTFLDSHLRPIASTLGTLAIAAGIVLTAGLAAPVAQAQLASTPDQATRSDAPRWTNTFEMQVKTLIEALSHALRSTTFCSTLTIQTTFASLPFQH